MCLASSDPKGPRRCSGESRTALCACNEKIAVMERNATILREVLDTPPAQPTDTVSFADKTSRVEDIRREIDTAVEGLAQPEAWQDWLEYASKFHHYSFGNQILIRIQRPDATQVAGFNKWKELGRDVTKGEKAIWVQAPMSVKVKGKKKEDADDGDNEDKRITLFRPVPVFDVAQTGGDPLPQPPMVEYTPETGDAPQRMHDDLDALIEREGFILEYRDLTVERGENAPEGYTDFNSKRVVISTVYGDAHQAVTKAHELAHIKLGHGERGSEYHTKPGGQRGTMEVEAESVAYVIGRHYGLKASGSAFPYIANWAQGDTKKVKATAADVNKACKEILGSLSEYIPETEDV